MAGKTDLVVTQHKHFWTMDDSVVASKISNNQKGALAEALFEEQHNFTPENFPRLYELIEYYIEQHLEPQIECEYQTYFEVFNSSDREPEYFLENPFSTRQWGFDPDLIVTVTARNLETWQRVFNAAFPIELKTGSSATLRINQREGIRKWNYQEDMPGCGFNVKVYLRKLPESYEYLVQTIHGNDHLTTKCKDAIKKYPCSSTFVKKPDYSTERTDEEIYEEEYGYPEDYWG